MSEVRDDISVGICGNPDHQAAGRLFVRPAEQRLSWERSIVGQNAGGTVPVLWRGCGHGCLDFLKPEVEQEQIQLETVEAEDIDMAVDEVNVVREIELRGFDDLDFD